MSQKDAAATSPSKQVQSPLGSAVSIPTPPRAEAVQPPPPDPSPPKDEQHQYAALVDDELESLSTVDDEEEVPTPAAAAQQSVHVSADSPPKELAQVPQGAQQDAAVAPDQVGDGIQAEKKPDAIGVGDAKLGFDFAAVSEDSSSMRRRGASKAAVTSAAVPMAMGDNAAVSRTGKAMGDSTQPQSHLKDSHTSKARSATYTPHVATTDTLQIKRSGATSAMGAARSDSSSSSSASSLSELNADSESDGEGGALGGALVGRTLKYTAAGGRPRPVSVLEYIADHGLHLVKFLDGEQHTARARLTAENTVAIADGEITRLMKDSARLARERAGARVQPKRRVQEVEAEAPPLPTPKRPRMQPAVHAPAPGPAGPGAGSVPGGHELIGAIISIRWPYNGAFYAALVVGCQVKAVRGGLSAAGGAQAATRVHKVFYIEDESTEELDLTKRDWRRGLADATTTYDTSGLVSKRIVVMWPVETDGDCMYDHLPYEAFVVAYLKEFHYRLLYTQHDQLEDRNLHGDQDSWDLSEPGSWTHDGLPIQTWSTFPSVLRARSR